MGFRLTEVSVRAAASSDFTIDGPGSCLYSGSDTEVSVPSGVLSAGRPRSLPPSTSVELPVPRSKTHQGPSAFEGAASLARVSVRDARGQVTTSSPPRCVRSEQRLSRLTALDAIDVPDSVSDIGPEPFALMPFAHGGEHRKRRAGGPAGLHLHRLARSSRRSHRGGGQRYRKRRRPVHERAATHLLL